MLRKLSLCAVLAALSLAAAAQELTLDQIVAKNIQARGGMEKLKGVKTLRVTGKMSAGSGMEIPIVMEMKRPSSMRMEMTLQGMTAVSAYDGKTGWSVSPFQGRKDPEPMGEEALKRIAEQADFDGPLVDYKDKGNAVELVGKVPIEGTDTYKLKLTYKNGDIHYFYLDADSFLEIKQEAKITMNGKELETESTLGDYKNVDGLMIPHSTSSGMKGAPQKSTMTFEKVEINVPIDDARFKMPEVKKEEPKAEPKKPGA